MRYRIADFEINAQRRELRRGTALVRTEPKVLDAILHLVTNRHRVVSKAELLDVLWPDEDVMEGALAVCIHRARRVLALEGSARQSLIETVPRRGYRLAAPVVELPPLAEPMQPPEAATGFVGRTDILSEIQAAARQSLLSQPQWLLLAGPQGIGKTTVLEESCHRLRREGFEVLRGSARGVGTIPFALWQQVIASYAASRSVSELRAALGTAGPVLAQLDAALARRLGTTLGHNVFSQPRHARLHLFESMAAALARIGSCTPLLILLDDLEEVDPSSALLVQFVARTLTSSRVLLLGAYRIAATTEGVLNDDRLRRLVSAPAGRMIPLDPLGDDEVGELLAHLADADVADPVRRAVIRASGGNPLLVREYWQGLVQDALIARCTRGWEMCRPAGDLPATVMTGIEHVSAPCRQMLEVAAVIGREVDGHVLRLACGRPRGRLAKAVGEAVAAGVLARVSGRRETYTWTHEALRERVLAECRGAPRAELHRRIADAIEQTHARTLECHVATIAYHLLAGIDAATASRAVSYAHRAALDAVRMLAFEDAAVHFSDALAALESYQPDARGLRWDLALGLAEAQLACGDETGARESFRRATVGEQATAPVPGATERAPARIHRFLTLMRTGLHLVVEDPERAREAVARRIDVLGQASRAARRAGDLHALAEALIPQRWNASHAAAIHDRLALSTEALLVAEHLGDPHLSQEARVLRIHDLLEHGRIDDVDVELSRYGALARELGEPAYLWVDAYMNAMRAHLDGRMERAEQLAAQAMTVGSTVAPDLAAAVNGAQTFAIRSVQGRGGEQLPWLEMVADQLPHIVSSHVTLAGVYCEVGRLDDARRALGRVRSLDFETDPVAGALWMNTLASLARICAFLGDVSRAQMIYERLAPYWRQFVVVPFGVLSLGSVACYLGVLATTAGRWSDALRHFEHGIDANLRSGNRPVHAHTQYEYACALLRRGGRRNRQQALALLDHAERTARELGLSGLVTWIENARAAASRDP